MSPEYLAGFFDGEGCVNINVRGKISQVCLRCDIVNTDLSILLEIQKHYGGYFYERKQKNPRWKPFRHLVWYGTHAAELLKKLQPFLRVKARQANLALEFTSFMQLSIKDRCEPIIGKTGRVFHRRTPLTLKRELDFKSQMHDLNRKGVCYAQ